MSNPEPLSVHFAEALSLTFSPGVSKNTSMLLQECRFVISVLVGCAILSLGMSVVINSNAGTGPNDLVAIILSDKLERIEFRWIRMGCDAFFVSLGFILGGTVGVGTIIAIFLTGPMVQFWLPKTKVLLQKIRV